MDLPQLLDCYIQFCTYRTAYNESKMLDLQDANWFCPTTLLPLGDFLAELNDSDYILPKNPNVKNYITTILKKHVEPHKIGDTYIPIMKATKFDQSHSEIICDLISKNMGAAEKTAVKLAVGELLDNVDQHSHCTSASFIAQRYEKVHCVEVSIFDNGITIPGSFKNSKYNELDDAELLKKAIGGLSTKEENTRGHGLPTFISILTGALKGEAIIVSGGAAYYTESNNNEKLYKLDKKDSLRGTLIGMRIPLPMKRADVYEYIK